MASSVLPFNKIPGPWPSLPFFGTSWHGINKSLQYFYKIYEANRDKYYRYGPIIKEYKNWRTSIVQIFHPNDFEEVLRNQGKLPNRLPIQFLCDYRLSYPDRYANIGLANLNGKKWLELRQLVSPILLNISIFEHLLPQQNIACDKFINYLKSNNGIIDNLHETIYRVALELLYNACLHENMGVFDQQSNEESELIIYSIKKLFNSFQELSFSRSICKWQYKKTIAYKTLKISEDNIYNITTKYIDKALKKINKGENLSSLLKQLLEINELSEKDIRTIILEFTEGGVNTIASSLTFLLYFLATNPSCQEILVDELRKIGVDKTKPINYSHLSSASYLKAALKESFRLASIIPNLVRILPKSVVLSGYEVPAKVPIILNYDVISKLDCYFDEAEKFKPERWLRLYRKSIHPFSSLPFGFGNRMCIGRRLAELIIYIVTMKTLANFRLVTDQKRINLRQAFIMIPEDKIRIKFTTR